MLQPSSGGPPPQADVTLTVPPTPPADTGTLLQELGAAASGPNDPLTATHVQARLVHDVADRVANPVAPPAVADARYKLVREVGRGSYGVVWEARYDPFGDREVTESVAVKFFTRRGTNWDAFLREVRRVSRLNDTRGILGYRDLGPAQHDPPYFVMPLAVNGSLADRLRDGGPMPVEEAVKFFARVVGTMAAVHAKGVIHCDIKPANVLIDAAGGPLVGDFGQAQLASDSQGSPGTAFFMPPEQATVDPSLPDTRWDVYALGAMLYQMLTGRPPRSTDDLRRRMMAAKKIGERLDIYRAGLAAEPRVDLRRAVRSADPTRARAVDPGLAGLVERCLDLDPKGRPATAGDVAAELKRWRWWRRVRPLIVLDAVITAGCVALLVVGYAAHVGQVVDAARDDLRAEVSSGLSRGAWFGSQLLEEKLKGRLRFVKEAAASAAADGTAREVGAAAEKLGTVAPDGAAAALDAAERRRFDEWLKRWGDERTRRLPNDTNRGATLLAAVGGRAYVLSRLTAEGEVDSPAAHPDLYDQDWSWRDYVNGEGNDHNGRGRPHAVVTQPHVSQAYRSTADGGPLKVDFSAPLRNPADPARVVGVVVVGLDIEKDLMRWLEGGDTAAKPTELVIVDDRNCVIRHPRHRIADDGKRDAEPVGALPAEGGQGFEYDDPLTPERETMLGYRRDLRPYGRDDGRTWAVIAQVPLDRAVKPVEDLRGVLWRTGLFALLGLAALAGVLWFGALRLLRRQEGSPHG